MSRIRLFLHRTPFHAAAQTRNSTRRIPRNHPSLPLPLESRFRWSYLWYAAVLGLGVTTGLGARQFAAPLGLPEPGSESDKLILESLGKDIDKLEIVQSLRSQSYNLHSDTALRTDAGLGAGGAKKISAYKGWLEVDINFTGTDEGKNGILGVMSGTRGLGVQRAFWNAETREMVAVVWMGGGLSGWPGVAHGGAIATVFEEIMARMRRGPEGPVGKSSIIRDVACCGILILLCRTRPPPRYPLSHIRETYLRPRFLHLASIVFETEPWSD
jgi:hypothetical protein